MMVFKNIIYIRFKQAPFFFPYGKNSYCHLRSIASDNKVTLEKRPLIAEKDNNLQASKKKILHSFNRKRSDYYGSYSFVVDERVAETIVNEVMMAVTRMDKATVIEVNPGLGKITKILMEKGLNKLIICEPLNCLLCQDIIEQCKDKVRICNVNKNGLTFNKPEHTFPIDIELKPDETAIVILINMNRRLLRTILERIVLVDQNYLKNYEFYVVVSQDIYQCFEDPDYQYTRLHDYVCFDLIYKVVNLAEFPRSAVLPLTSNANKKKMYFLRLERKDLDFYNLDLINYWNFLKILTMKKYKPVLAVVEKWFPGCGLVLISKGFPVNTIIFELTRKDIFALYKILEQHENFDYSMKILGEEQFP